jgi:hypothetical protein
MSPASIVRSSIAKIATVAVIAATLFQWPGLSARPAAAATLQPARLSQTSSAGYALNFDGMDDQAMLGQTGPMLGAGWESSKTVELWVKPTGSALSGPSPAHLDLVFGDRPRWWGISRGVLQGQDRLWVWNYDGNYDMIAVEYTAGQWTHIALVHSGGLLHAYKDGALVGSVASGVTQQPSTGAQPTLYFGGMIINAARNYTFGGEIDELRLWNAGLDGGTLQTWMAQELSAAHPALANLRAYYRMANGAGSAVSDDSGHGFTGALLGGMGDANWVSSGAFGGPVNLAPTADAQAVSLAEDGALAIALTGADPESQPLSFILLSQPAHGALSGDAPNLIYTPATNYHGPDSFTFQVSDGQLSSPAAAVSIAVTPVNDAPVANDDLATTLQDTPMVIAVLANDSDVDGDPLSVSALSQPAYGAASSDGVTVTYTPNAGYFGSDGFSYTVSDGNGGSATAQVTLTVQWVNAPPVALADSALTAEDQALVVDVLANDFDSDGHALLVTAVSSAAYGTVQHDGASVTYAPNSNFHGSDAFSYTISDGYGGESTAAVAVVVTPVNDDPVAIDDAATTNEDTPISIAALANDFDVDGDALSIVSLGAPTLGAVTIDGASLLYTPAADLHGSDAFTYTVSDGNGGSATAQVMVTILPVNDPPAAGGDSALTAEDTPVSIAVLVNDFDSDGDLLAIAAVGQPANGAAVVAGAQIVYTPAADFHGADAFVYTISDGNGGQASAQVVVVVTPVNDDPIAQPDSAATSLGTAVTIAVLANDSDVDGDALSVSALSQPAYGAASSNGVTVTYTPNAGYFGSDAFSYTLSDGNGGSATALVTVAVSGSAGYALNFDGMDDQAMLGQTGPMLGAGWGSSKTVELWVKPTGDTLSGPSPAHLDLVFGDRPRWWGISRGVLQGQDRLWVWNYDGNYDMIAVEYTAGQWTHIALVHSGGLLHAYKDGALVGSVASGVTQQPSTGAQPTLYFGGMIINAARNYTFGGEIDELRLWNTGLDAGTLQAWRNQELTPAHPALANLRAYYRMANGAGAAVSDDSGHGFTGALLGGMDDANWTSSGAFAN